MWIEGKGYVLCLALSWVEPWGSGSLPVWGPLLWSSPSSCKTRTCPVLRWVLYDILFYSLQTISEQNQDIQLQALTSRFPEKSIILLNHNV